MKIVINLVKSFTQNPEQGNPTGIILEADNLTDEQMLSIAKKLNFSESAFVQKSEKATYRTRFFAPEKEVALCGHATLATFHILVEEGKLSFEDNEVSITQETLAGILPITGHKDGLIVMTQRNSEFFPIETDRKLLARLLGISLEEILEQPIQAVSTGTPKLIIPVVSLDVLRKIQPDLEGIKEYCKKKDAKGFYPYTTETIEKGSDFHARQFNPLADINEDPVTGIAAGALGCYIREHNLSNKTTFIVEQGYNMGKAGRMIVDISDGVKVGGYCVTYGKETLTIT